MSEDMKKDYDIIEGLPRNATNGDMIKAIFHPYKVYEHISYVNVYLTEEDDLYINKWGSFEKDWWNAPYKRDGGEG